MSEASPERVNFRPLHLVTALRAGIAALLVAFGVILFLSFGKKEEEPVRIHFLDAADSPGAKVVDLSENFAITGTKGGKDSFRMRAEKLTGFMGDKKLLEGVHLEVFGTDGERITLTGATGQFDLADKRAQLSGNVLVEGKNGFKLRTTSLYYDGQRDMIFTPDEISFESAGLEGTGRGLNYLTRTEVLKIPADAHVRTRPQIVGEPPVEVTSSDMTLGLRDNEVVFNESVTLTRGAESFAANYLKALLDESRKRVVSLKAYGQVHASFVAGPGAVPATLQADSLLATMAPEGTTVKGLKALGNCRLSHQGVTATCGDVQAEAGADRIALRGDPVVQDGRGRIAAQEIDLHPEAGGLEARGDVKTSLQGAAQVNGTVGPSYFSGKEPVFFQAARLVVEDAGAISRYSGSARGWQADDSIQAEEIVLHFADRRMKAFRNVLCRFAGAVAQGAAAAGSPAPPLPTVILASSMDYDEAEGTVHYRNAVKLTRQDAVILADRMHIALTDPASGTRRIARVLAEGSVSFTHLSHTGKADRMIYSPDGDVAEMQQDAGLAEVVDRTDGSVLRGKTLTFDIKGNRVLTETKEGGRTWITLSPKDKDGRGFEAKIRH